MGLCRLWGAAAWLASAAAVLWLLPSAGFAGQRWSQLEDTVFHHINAEQGLPNTIATAFAEDRQGFIWVGTQSGLSRWDGYRFRTYQPQAGDEGSLPSPIVQTLRVDAAGRLWVGTSGGLARYDADAERFVRYASGAQRLASPLVLSLADDGAGGLWVGTASGLDHLHTASGAVTHVVAGAASGLPPGRIPAVLRDHKGTLWVGTQQGLYRRVTGAATFEAVRLAVPPDAVASVERLLEDGTGTLWIGTRRNGAFRLDASQAQPQAVQASATPGAPNTASENIGSLVEAAPGTIWIGTFGSGVLAVDAASGNARSIRRDRTLPSSLADDNVWALLRDRSGLVWVGSNRGVSVHSPAQVALTTVFADSSRRSGVTDSEIFAVATAADGRVWLGMGSNGVDVLDPQGMRVAQLRPDASQAAKRSLPKDRVWSLATAPDGAVYLGTNRGLYRSDVHASKVERLTLAGRSVVENTQTLLLDGDTLFVGGTAGGLWSLDRTSGRSRQLGAATFADQRIITMALGASTVPGSRSLWVASASNLYVVSIGVDAQGTQTDSVRAIATGDTAAAEAGLSGITSLLRDADGRLWIGTDAGDLQILDTRTATPGAAQLQRVREPAPQNRGIDKLLQDPSGTVWASTDGGLVTVDPKTRAIRSFSRADGDAFTAGYWADSGAATAQGELVFGALGGLSVVRTDRLSQWRYQPPVVVTDLRIGGKPHAAHPFTSGAGTATLKIPADGNSIVVEFSALDYSAPERNRYAYRLHGVDSDWVETDASRRLATYANLPPGDYRLELRGSNRNGEWSPAVLSLPIAVLPAWYQTLWFRAALLVAALAGVYGIVAVRTAVLRLRQRELERKVSERTAQLEAASRALEEASLTDPLTGLRNRRFLMQHLEADAVQAIRRYEAKEAAQLPPPDADLVFYLIDLDHFKQVNDLYGHPGGDAVLMQLPARIKSVFRETDYFIRWGGEEFLVVARNTSRSSAAERAERIRTAVADTAFLLPDGVELRKTCSIGFAAFPFVPQAPRAVSWEAAIELADAALYAAKRAGRDGWVGLGAGEGAQAEGLVQRFKPSPATMVANAEMAIATSLPMDAVVQGLGGER